MKEKQLNADFMLTQKSSDNQIQTTYQTGRSFGK